MVDEVPNFVLDKIVQLSVTAQILWRSHEKLLKTFPCWIRLDWNYVQFLSICVKQCNDHSCWPYDLENSNQLVLFFVVVRLNYWQKWSQFSPFTPVHRALMRAVQSITIGSHTNCKCPTIWMAEIGYFLSRERDRYQILWFKLRPIEAEAEDHRNNSSG